MILVCGNMIIIIYIYMFYFVYLKKYYKIKIINNIKNKIYNINKIYKI
jgi:hypothetical protein